MVFDGAGPIASACVIAFVGGVRGVGEDGHGAVCGATGRLYDTVARSVDGSVPKLEGGPCATFGTENEAWLQWIIAFLEYSDERPGRLHWRKRPELMWIEANGEKLFYVVSRLSVG